MTTRIAASDLTDDRVRQEHLRANVLAKVRSRLGADGVLEHRFHPTRRWQLDAAWPEEMVALEVDGGLHRMKKTKRDGTVYYTTGRHNTAEGYLADMEKLNELAIAGWCLVRATWSDVDLGIAAQLVERAIKARRRNHGE